MKLSATAERLLTRFESSLVGAERGISVSVARKNLRGYIGQLEHELREERARLAVHRERGERDGGAMSLQPTPLPPSLESGEAPEQVRAPAEVPALP